MNKKLVLYSDQEIPENKKVDLKLLELLGKSKPQIGYIPSRSDLERKYFGEKVEYYKQYGITDLFYFDLDQEFDEQKIEKLVSCDAIHLSGGNTFYFLHILKKRKFVTILRDFVRKGGVLIGVSAGSILMSNTINIVNIKDYDENTISLDDLTSLGLVDFEFFAHLNQREEWLDRVVEYSKTSKSVIYACNDSDGIIINGNKTEFLGGILRIEKGKITKAR